MGCIIYELFTLNEYYIDKIIDDKDCIINADIYNQKWQILINVLLEKDYHKRPNINEICDYIMKIDTKYNSGFDIVETIDIDEIIDKDEINQENSGMYERNFYLGQKILFECFLLAI